MQRVLQTPQDRNTCSHNTHDRIAFHYRHRVGVLNETFEARYLARAHPQTTLQTWSHDHTCMPRAVVARYAFNVQLFHLLLYAGLSRRTPVLYLLLYMEAN